MRIVLRVETPIFFRCTASLHHKCIIVIVFDIYYWSVYEDFTNVKIKHQAKFYTLDLPSKCSMHCLVCFPYTPDRKHALLLISCTVPMTTWHVCVFCRPSQPSSRMRARQRWRWRPPGTCRMPSRPRTAAMSTGEGGQTEPPQLSSCAKLFLLKQLLEPPCAELQVEDPRGVHVVAGLRQDHHHGEREEWPHPVWHAWLPGRGHPGWPQFGRWASAQPASSLPSYHDLRFNCLTCDVQWRDDQGFAFVISPAASLFFFSASGVAVPAGPSPVGGQSLHDRHVPGPHPAVPAGHRQRPPRQPAAVRPHLGGQSHLGVSGSETHPSNFIPQSIFNIPRSRFEKKMF